MKRYAISPSFRKPFEKQTSIQVNRARWLVCPSGRSDDCPSDIINSLQPQQYVGTQSITGDEVIAASEIGSICSAKGKTSRRCNRSTQQFQPPPSPHRTRFELLLNERWIPRSNRSSQNPRNIYSLGVIQSIRDKCTEPRGGEKGGENSKTKIHHPLPPLHDQSMRHRLEFYATRPPRNTRIITINGIN